MSDENTENIKNLAEAARAAGQDGEPVQDEGGVSHDYDIPVAEDPNDDRERVICAFVIYQRADGSCIGSPDLDVLDRLKVQRQATPDDMHRGATEVAKDVEVLQTAHATVQEVMQVSQQIAQAQANQRVAQQAGVGGQQGPGGLHVPGS